MMLFISLMLVFASGYAFGYNQASEKKSIVLMLVWFGCLVASNWVRP